MNDENLAKTSTQSKTSTEYIFEKNPPPHPDPNSDKLLEDLKKNWETMTVQWNVIPHSTLAHQMNHPIFDGYFDDHGWPSLEDFPTVPASVVGNTLETFICENKDCIGCDCYSESCRNSE